MSPNQLKDRKSMEWNFVVGTDHLYSLVINIQQQAVFGSGFGSS